MQQLELKIPPLALWLVLALAILALGSLIPDANVPFQGHVEIAVVLLAVGISVVIAAVVQFNLATTTVNPLCPSQAKTIVAAGVFRLSRNPMYLGMALTLLGISAWRSTLAGYTLVPCFCLYITAFQIKPEEKALLDKFGEEFASYMNRVRRWL